MEVLLVLLGVIVGITISLICFAGRSVGTLRIDQSDPTEQPYLFLDLDKPVATFANKKRVLVRVSKKNFISEER